MLFFSLWARFSSEESLAEYVRVMALGSVENLTLQGANAAAIKKTLPEFREVQSSISNLTLVFDSLFLLVNKLGV